MLYGLLVRAQTTMDLQVQLNQLHGSLEIQQQISYTNTSKDTLKTIVLNDWANAFSSKTTPLALRFAENFRNGFHYEKNEDRGRTVIFGIEDERGIPVSFRRDVEVDRLVLAVDQGIPPGSTYRFDLSYSVKLPDARFTRYGITADGQFNLKYWYLVPAVYKNGWVRYSHKNTDDFYQDPTAVKIAFTLPNTYRLWTDLDQIELSQDARTTTYTISGSNRVNLPIYLRNQAGFSSVVTDQFELITDLNKQEVPPPVRALLIDRLTRYLQDSLGPYPHQKMIVSEADYKNNPVYGLNQLPDFLSPFKSEVELDLELLKSVTRRYLVNTLPLDIRKDHWLIGALQIHLMKGYIETYYPDMKVLGRISDFFVIRWSHLSDLKFNQQYTLLYMNMARRNLHQPLSTPRDSLVKFNKNIASDYYAGKGFDYLNDYLGESTLNDAIRGYYQNNLLDRPEAADFQKELEGRTSLPVDWFFDDFVEKRTTIDFKIKKVEEAGDSLLVTVRNKKETAMPVSLYGLDKDSVVYKRWMAPIDSSATISIPKEGINKLALNYEAVIPEYNQRNNYKNLNFGLNRPLQFRLFKDVEDPRYNQVFLMPVFSYNIYDGFALGPKIYNSTVVPKAIHYKIEPLYGFRSKRLLGKASIVYNDFKSGTDLYNVRYGVAGSVFSYNTDLLYRRYSPYIVMSFRDHEDLRNNKKQFINIRNVTVDRDPDPNDPGQDPNYSVYNAQYVYSDKNLINYYRGVADFQVASQFTKLSVQFEYRKLFQNNSQLNLRLYSGVFLSNNTAAEDDFFSFALDRPTDYLFDYNYYGRSEDSGLFSQQLIVAEGGFKSQLEPAFANSWITTLNATTNIWKWIFVYADAGLVKNKGQSVEPVFDSGIRASLVADYFEIYFPLYSSLGWEPGLGNYDQRIRFIVTLDLRTLFGLFTREWY